MNTLSRLDSYVSSLFSPSSSSSNSASSSSSSSSSSLTRPQLKRFATPPSQLSSSVSSTPSSSPRLSNLPPTPRRGRKRIRRRAPQTYSSIKVPPPTTPLILRIALVLWSILLAFWRSLVGETRAGRSRKRKGVRKSGGGGVLRELGERVMVSAGIGMLASGEGDGSGSEAEAEADIDVEPASEDGDDGWVDPVTRAPDDQDSLDAPLPTEDEFAVATIEDEPTLAQTQAQAQAQARTDPPKFTFRLKSAPLKQGSLDAEDETIEVDARPAFAGYQRPPTPRSILSNPLPGSTASPIAAGKVTDEDGDQLVVRSVVKPNTDSSASNSIRKTPHKILANPISTSILDPSVPAPSSNSASSLFRKASPPLRVPRPHQTPFHLQKTLILDLDETLIHSTSRPLSGSSSGGGGILGLSLGGLVGRGKGREGHAVEVVLNGRSTMYHVYKRPYVDHFLKKVASWYTLVIFTASMPEYADPVIDWLDAGRNLFARKLYRDSCHLQPNGSYTKDLSLVEADLSRVCFMDNSPVSYNWNKANALPIEGWTSDPYDEALLHSIPVLDSLRFVNDVRRVLGIRGFT